MSKPEIVISGLSGRFPNSNNVDEFWENLVSGRDMITGEPRRWPAGMFGLPERAGLLHDIESFDAAFFGVSAKQAHQMDPQLRIMLEVCYEAILDSGYHPAELKGKKIGVYVGGSSSEAYDAWTIDADSQTGYGLLGCCRCMLANRVAFTFDFRGPSYTLDTACSSSMFAVDAAFKAIQMGECDMAIAAGVNLLLKPNCSLDFHRLSMLSMDGCCKVFDERANGYVRAETVAAVIIAKESLARRAYAKVLGTRTNTDGFKEDGITYPNHVVQSELLRDLYSTAGVHPNDVYYLEMHGTGTQAGDTQEMLGVEKFFLESPRSTPLHVGSVKSNMGHSEPSSGVAALAKILLSYYYKKIPANINFLKANPKLDPITSGKVKPVISSHLELRPGDIIGVNSFGFGGANAHVILQGFGQDEALSVNSAIPMLVPYYNRRADHTRAALCRVRDEHVTQDKLSYMHMISQKCAGSNVTRGYVVLNGVKKEPVVAEAPPANDRQLWFVMTGMGAQWPQMGTDMMQYTTFKRSIDECAKALAEVPGCNIDVHHLLTSPDANLQTPENAFVGLCAVQIGLVNLLSEFGLKPDGLVGHSVGELVCGYADNCLDIKQTIIASYFRGKCIKDAGLEEGGMAAVGLTWEEAQAICPSGVVAACHNAEDSVTISGNKAAVEELVVKLQNQDVFAKMVSSCGVAFHSPTLAAVGPQLSACLAPVITEPKKRSPGWICTSKKESEWESAQYCDAGYLSNNLVSPVWFHNSLSHIPENSIVVEIAACGLLQSILKRALPTCSILSLMKRKDPKCVEFFLNSIGKLWNWGINPSFSRFYEAPSLPLVHLPPMAGLVQWDHEVQYTTPSYLDFSSGGGGGPQVSFSYKVDTADASSDYVRMKDHVIDGRNLLPATGYLCLVWRAIASTLHSTPDKTALRLADIALHQATILNTSEATIITVTLSPGTRRFEVTSRDSLVVSGTYTPTDADTDEIVTPTTTQTPGDLMLQPDAVYKEFRLRGYEYGPLYQGIVEADNRGIAGKLKWDGDWVSFLDTMLQVQLMGSMSRALRLPTRIRKLEVDPANQPASGEDVPFHWNSDTKQCWAGAALIEGLHSTLSQRRPQLKPVMLETYDFVPYNNHVIMPGDVTTPRDLTTHASFVEGVGAFLEKASLRHLLDIAQENITKLSALSVCEVGGESALKKSVEAVLNINPGRAVCDYSVAVATKEEMNEEVDYFTVWDAAAHESSECYDIIVTSSVACSGHVTINNLLNSLTTEGFLVFLSPPSFSLDLAKIQGEVVSSKTCSFASLHLLRVKSSLSEPRTKRILLSNTDFRWTETLQSAALDETVDRIWLCGDHSTGVQGICNALRQEDCGHKIRSLLASGDQESIFKQAVSRDLVSNVYKNGEWGTYRHNHSSLTTSSFSETSTSFAYVDTLTRGDLSSLSWIQASSPASPPPNTLTCDVSYASLNFRDIMIATGKLPPDALPMELQGSNDCVLGLEYSGHVSGTKQRVMGILPVKALATRVTTQREFTWEVPESWSLEAAASVPVVYCTAYYSLISRGRLRQGQSVLIHSGSGGVGQAAIAIALSMSCNVFTTVGSQQKIDFLLGKFPALKRENILHSRSVKFEEDIMNLTNSRGVDVVLNSLSADKLKASLRCVARHGRFLEIGKYDMSEDNPIGLAVFLKNISFHGILLDALFESGNDEWQSVRDMLSDGIKRGVVQPLPTTAFYSDQLEQAFRFMSQGKHIGKVVISTTDKTGSPPASVIPRFSCTPHTSYIVTGGLGGFGLELIQWLADQGARHLVVTSRSGAKSSYQKWIVDRLGRSGVDVSIVTSDTTTEAGCRGMLEALQYPVSGIFHLAGILRDGLLENLTVKQFEEVFKAKVDTAVHLDKLSREMCPQLRQFVCFSSVVSGRGNSGQCNYAAANSTLERICEARLAAGLPGLAIQWGAIGDVGMAHSMVGNDADIGGTYPQRIWNCLSTLGQAMTMGAPVVSSIVLADKETGESTGSDADLVTVVSNIMGASDPSKLDHDASLGDLGLDSLMGVEVKQALDRAEIRLTSKEIRGLTLSGLAKLQNGGGDKEKRTKKGSEGECCKVLKTVPGTTPIYLIHPITLDIAPFVNIAEHLKMTVVAVQLTKSTPLASVEVLASYYLGQVKKHSKGGKFRLGGYSFGAVLAFEMALQLHNESGAAAQELSQYLVLIDGSPNWVRDQIQKGIEEIMKIRCFTSLDKTTESIISYIQHQFNEVPDGLYEKLSALSPDIAAQVKVATSVLASTRSRELPPDTEYKMYHYTRLLLIGDQYKPASLLPWPVHLVKAVDSFQSGHDYGLGELCQGAVTVDKVSGNHETCVADFHDQIAQHINNHVDGTKNI